MSHPDPDGPPDLTPIKAGEIWENPVAGERLTILESPWGNPEGRRYKPPPPTKKAVTSD